MQRKVALTRQNMALILRQQRTYGWMRIVLKFNAPHLLEDRRIIIGKYYNKLWTAIYTMRGDAIRIISVRRTRKKEAELYDKEKVG